MRGTISKRRNAKGKAFYVPRFIDPVSKRERSKCFPNKQAAQAWLDEQTASITRNEYVDRETARKTVAAWCETWQAGYGGRPSTVRQARVHVAQIVREFGSLKLADVRPSQVKAWTVKLRAEGYADSYVYALHRRLAQIMGDAVLDGVIPRSPCSRRTSPRTAEQRPYLLTTDQLWQLHDAVPEHLRPAILLGAFAGLRVAEVVALKVEHVDFLRGIVTPVQQGNGDPQPLKSKTSRTALPCSRELATLLSPYVAKFGTEWMVTDGIGGRSSSWAIERAIRSARKRVPGLPDGLRFHDLRHYLASLLIGCGADVKVVQHRLRHASAKTTLDTYAHLWPDGDELATASIAAVLGERAGAARERGAGGGPRPVRQVSD
ncbi:tyrosine-type recombinase/integrase [Geodermatophilus sp. SYSU D01045]